MSENMIPFIVLASFAVLLTVFVFGSHFLMQRRYRRAYAKLASSRGFEFTPEHKSLVNQLKDFQLFKQEGTMPGVENLVDGQKNDVRILLFTSTRSTSSDITGADENSRWHHCSVCVGKSEKLDLPACAIRPRGFLDKLRNNPYAEWTEYGFDQDPDFSAVYEVRGLDEGAVHLLVDGPFRDWLMQHRDEHLYLETNGKMFAVHYNRRVPARIGRRLIGIATELQSLGIS